MEAGFRIVGQDELADLHQQLEEIHPQAEDRVVRNQRTDGQEERHQGGANSVARENTLFGS